MGGEIKLKLVDNLAGLVGQTVLADERHHGTLHRREGGGKVENDALVATFKLLLLV